jgi:hypothetical protein
MFLNNKATPEGMETKIIVNSLDEIGILSSDKDRILFLNQYSKNKDLLLHNMC